MEGQIFIPDLTLYNFVDRNPRIAVICCLRLQDRRRRRQQVTSKWCSLSTKPHCITSHNGLTMEARFWFPIALMLRIRVFRDV